MPYFFVSSTKEAIVKAEDERDAPVEMCSKIDNDHSGADVRELDPNDKDDAELIRLCKIEDGDLKE